MYVVVLIVVQKKVRKQRKAGKVQRVIDGGDVQVGTCERPGRCQPLRKKDLSMFIIPVVPYYFIRMYHRSTPNTRYVYS